MKTEESKNNVIPMHTRLINNLKTLFTKEKLKSFFNINKFKDFFNIEELGSRVKEHKVITIIISVLLLFIISLLLIKPIRIKAHVNALGSGDAERIKKAEIELTKAGKRAINPLMKAVNNREPDIGRASIKVLAEIKEPRATEFLQEIVKDPNKDISIREEAAKAIAGKGDAKSLEMLVEVLTSEREVMGKSIGDILVETGELSVNPLISAIEEYDVSEYSPTEILIRLGESSVEPLIKVLNEENIEVKKCAIDALGKIGDKKAIDPIIKSLNKDPEVKDIAFDALASLGRESVSDLFPLLESDDKDIKTRSIKLFGDIGGADAVKPLFEMILKQNTDFYEEIFDAFSNIGGPAVGALITSFRIPDKDIKVNAAKVLIEIGEPAVNDLIFSLREEDYSIRWLSAATLCKMTHLPSVKKLLQNLNEDNNESAVRMVSWAYPFYILMGVRGSDAIMIEAINKYGSPTMAEDYMNSGNEMLANAAYIWAENNGYEVEKHESSAGTPRWGSAPES